MELCNFSKREFDAVKFNFILIIIYSYINLNNIPNPFLGMIHGLYTIVSIILLLIYIDRLWSKGNIEKEKEEKAFDYNAKYRIIKIDDGYFAQVKDKNGDWKTIIKNLNKFKFDTRAKAEDIIIEYREWIKIDRTNISIV